MAELLERQRATPGTLLLVAPATPPRVNQALTRVRQYLAGVGLVPAGPARWLNFLWGGRFPMFGFNSGRTGGGPGTIPFAPQPATSQDPASWGFAPCQAPARPTTGAQRLELGGGSLENPDSACRRQVAADDRLPRKKRGTPVRFLWRPFWVPPRASRFGSMDGDAVGGGRSIAHDRFPKNPAGRCLLTKGPRPMWASNFQGICTWRHWGAPIDRHSRNFRGFRL